jgi:hypothetical protein
VCGSLPVLGHCRETNPEARKRDLEYDLLLAAELIHLTLKRWTLLSVTEQHRCGEAPHDPACT